LYSNLKNTSANCSIELQSSIEIPSGISILFEISQSTRASYFLEKLDCKEMQWALMKNEDSLSENEIENRSLA
jgi:hypothetical protein